MLLCIMVSYIHMIIDILIKNKRYTFLTLMESLSAREVCDRQKYLYLLDIAWKKKKIDTIHNKRENYVRISNIDCPKLYALHSTC